MNCCSFLTDGAPRCCHGWCSLSTCQPHFGSRLITSGSILFRSGGYPCILFSLGLFLFSFLKMNLCTLDFRRLRFASPHVILVVFPIIHFSETFLKLCFGSSKLLVRLREIWFCLNVTPLHQISIDVWKNHHLSLNLTKCFVFETELKVIF